ncbi:MAG: hypothetical protein Q7T87_10110 [Polaromonas sp.]|nr:hypothetical protein [Polaromonas sp.]
MLSFLCVNLEKSILYFFYTLLAKQRKVTCRRATPGLVVKGTTSTNEQGFDTSTRTAVRDVEFRAVSSDWRW